ncbi:MAG: MFS transporter [Oscillospiraceae bacterium]|nr:MFS transporter [Oscillospiraceae bacterium]
MKNTITKLRSFLLLWISQAVSSLGTAMTEYALIVWNYRMTGTAFGSALLTLCTFAPTILFRFAAGAIADRWDKKRIMLFADLFAACGTFSIYLLYSFSSLRVWHLYIINVLLSFMNAFQEPAAFVATSLLVPKEYYAKAGGLQGISDAAVSVLAPTLGACVLTLGGLKVILICDLCSFFAAFIVLLFFVRIPKVGLSEKEQREPFRKTCAEGFRFLHSHPVMIHLILFMTGVNFLAKMGNDGLLSPFVLARTNDQQILGAVQSCVALGVMTGSLISCRMKPVKNKPRLIAVSTAIVFSGNIFQGLSQSPSVWCAAALVAYATAAVMNTNMTVFMREQVPLEMQGRVFSAESTLKNCFIPFGLFLGGLSADHVFEPFMKTDSPLQRWLIQFFDDSNGAGIAVQFTIVGILGILLCLAYLKRLGDPRT